MGKIIKGSDYDDLSLDLLNVTCCLCLLTILEEFSPTTNFPFSGTVIAQCRSFLYEAQMRELRGVDRLLDSAPRSSEQEES